MFIGREDELNALDALWGRDSGVLVTCRGRRRIGKSTLIEEFAARTSDRLIAIEGAAAPKGRIRCRPASPLLRNGRRICREGLYSCRNLVNRVRATQRNHTE